MQPQITSGKTPAYCERKRQLLYELADAIKWLNSVQSLKTDALRRNDDAEVQRFDQQLLEARELKQEIWDALMGHMTVHGCMENREVDERR